MTEKFTDLKKDAIFNHPDCRVLFEESINGVWIKESIHGKAIMQAFGKIFLSIPYSKFNFSIEEYESLFNAVYGNHWCIHTGIVLKVIDILENTAPNLYMQNDEITVMNYINSFYFIKAEIHTLITPIRDKVIEDFYASATIIQQNAINHVVNQMKKQNNFNNFGQ